MTLVVIGDKLPIARGLLRVLRDKNTGVGEFRRAMRLAGVILALEVSRELEWVTEEVETPLGVRTSELRLRRNPLIIGVLGASLPLIEGFQEVYREAPVALVAAKRIESPGGVDVKVYYERMPGEWRGHAIVVDPMLATGLTVGKAIDSVLSRGASKVVVASVIASAPGVSYIESRFPGVSIYTLALDPALNDKYFIVPGLGDAGDRSLGVSPG